MRKQFKTLKMPTAAAELDMILSEQKRTIHLEWLSKLLTSEIDARHERSLSMRIKRAEFPEITSIETFDWSFNPDIDKEKVDELLTLDFIRQHQIALFLGKPGTGKTHLAVAIGLLATQQNMRVFCSSMKKLSAQILKAKARNQIDELFKRILSSQLWILDDWAVISMPTEIAEEVFDLLDRRRPSTALLVTSNRDIEEWSQVFPEPVIAAAAIDRIFDRATIVTFTGRSYRLNSRIQILDSELPTVLRR